MSVAPPTPKTGLTVPASDPYEHAGDATAFYWLNPLAHTPATYIFRAIYYSQVDYYTNFFRCGNFGGDFAPETGFYGCHPFPAGGVLNATPHTFEISTGVPHTDIESLVNVSYGIEYVHCVIVTGTLLRPIIDFYYDFANSLNKVTYNWTSSAANYVDGPTPGLMFLNNPWPTEKSEAGYGSYRGFQIYSDALSVSDAQIEAANDAVNIPQTLFGLGKIWYMNQNPTPSDISDKSGNGHNPSWQNARRPTLYTV
jgi:hypothetical protein